MSEIKTVLFDLDGTLLDTAPDLAFALNETLKRYQQPPLPFDTIRPVVSHGGMALIKLGFNLQPNEAGFEERRQFLLDVYLNNLARETVLFDGMENVLSTLEQARIPWGVVTNKPAWLTDPLMAQMGLDQRAVSIVSGDTLPQRKPDPAPVLLACEQAGTAPEHCIYIGDAERDITAGKRAGTQTAAALFGYLMPGDDPQSWQADHQLERPEQLLDIL